MIGPAGAGREVHHVGIAPEERHYGDADDAVRAKG